jgi:hypothetical protein
MIIAGDLGSYVTPPIQGEIYFLTVGAGGAAAIDLTNVANRPAGTDIDWWFAHYIAIQGLSGVMLFALGTAADPALVPGFAGNGFDPTGGMQIPATGVLAPLLPRRTEGKTHLRFASVLGARVAIWRASPAG